MSIAASPLLRQGFFFSVLIAVPVSSFFLVFKPQNAEIDRAKNEIEHKQGMLEKLRLATGRSEDLARSNEQIRESIEAIEARLPSDREMDNILRQVAALAAENGLTVPGFKKVDKPVSAGLAMEQPLEVEFTGNFDGFYSFLLQLEQLPRITRISNLDILRSKDIDGEMQAKCVLSVYYQRDGSEAK
jgi:type IV pilus assembly protein PilO